MPTVSDGCLLDMCAFRFVFTLGVAVLPLAHAAGDEVLYQYEGETFPEAAGWEEFNPCEDPCTSFVDIDNGHFVLEWSQSADVVHYSHVIAQDPTPPPPTLWVEWQFRSNLPLEPNFWSCDGGFTVDYGGMHDTINMYGDTAISFGGDFVVQGLEVDEFHTYRYESLDGLGYLFFTDGQLLVGGYDDQPDGGHYLQFSGGGGCQSQDVVNRWDFIRYGTISEGEVLVSSDPPAGELSTGQYSGLDRFTVTFDAPNYVHVDDITVEVTDGDAPVVLWTRRLEDGAPETVQVVLDRPLPVGETVTFTFPDPDGPEGPLENVVEYTLRQPIPAASTWGLATLALLLLTAATVTLQEGQLHPGDVTPSRTPASS